MKTLIFFSPISYKNPQFPPLLPPVSLFYFPFPCRQNVKVLQRISHSNITRPPKRPCFTPIRSSATSSSVTYGGWEDLSLGGDSVSYGESTRLRSFLVSVGIDDKKHVFMFVLGAFFAFSISRVRISSIIVFPASALVFAIGFSLGFVRGGNFNEFSVNAIKRKAKEEIFRVCGERLSSLVGFFDEFDVRVDNLKNDFQRAIGTKEIELARLESYVGSIESLQSSALSSREVAEATLGYLGNSNDGLSQNTKSSRKKKEVGEVWFELLQYIGGVFGEKLVDPKPNKLKDKDNVKQGTLQNSENDQTRENKNTSAPAVKERVTSAVNNGKGSRNASLFQDATNESVLDWDEEKRIRIISGDAESNFGHENGNVNRCNDSQQYFYLDNREQYVNNRSVSERVDQKGKTVGRASNGDLHNYVDFSVSLKHTETETASVKRQILGKSNENYRSSYSSKMTNDESYGSQVREGKRNNDLHLVDQYPTSEDEADSSSSAISDDVLFDRYLTEANNLLKKAKECTRGRYDEEQAEILLYKSAKLLSKAIAMKPMSLLAVGQLGNTYLLHGELKLRISRELRTLLSRRDPLSFENHSRILKGLKDQAIHEDHIASLLVDVCEECEELLVEAGRKYRIALSIDGNDARALYNWGLALSFRAQLIADIGPEAAVDADKVFLAAINKFDAMMSKSNVYAPDALFRWGMALQHRSRLRPANSKEKAKLLQQAKRLYEDALHMESDNLQVREALSACTSELIHRLR